MTTSLYSPAGEKIRVLKTVFKMITQRQQIAPPQPAEALCVIGDVHGCLLQLEKLLQQVPSGHRCILVGDYIDRGEQSSEVLRFLYRRTDLTCLMGNHEDMLLRFLKSPEHAGPRWLLNGGLQTLAAFGIRGIRPQMTTTELNDCRNRLRAAMGEDLVDFLANLRTSVISGNILIAHAGADPKKAPHQQEDRVLKWGHPDFHHRRQDGFWLVHGHTIVPRPLAENGRIAVDTGAFANGTLSAVCLEVGAPIKFLEASL